MNEEVISVITEERDAAREHIRTLERALLDAVVALAYMTKASPAIAERMPSGMYQDMQAAIHVAEATVNSP